MANAKTKLVALAIGLAAAMPLAAQSPNTPGGSPGTVQQDEGFDWGWLGLLGLIGLAGLRRRDDTHTRTTSTANRL